MEKKLIRFDWAIKNLLRDKSNFGILEGFLSELLKETIKIHRILESESNQEYDEDKFNRVDLLVENSAEELIIIEVQNTSELDYLQRILYGSSKTIVENMELGKPYTEVKKVISVSVVYFDLGRGEDYVYKGKTDFHGIHKNDDLELSEKQKEIFGKERVYQIFPEYYLLKINKFDNETRDKLDEWIYFLKNEEIKENFSAKGIQEAKQKLDILKLPREDQLKYKRYLENLSYQESIALSINAEMEEKIEKVQEKLKKIEKIAEEKGEEKGKIGEKIGRNKEKYQVIDNGIEKGLSVGMLADLTGLNVNEINEYLNGL